MAWGRVGVAPRAKPDLRREFVSHPTDFLCFAKESQQRKATPGRAPVRRLWRRGSLALLESQGRHGMARRLRRRLAVAEIPLTFCDAQRALRGGKTATRKRISRVFSRKHHPRGPKLVASHVETRGFMFHKEPLAARHRVIPAQAGIQAHPQRTAGQCCRRLPTAHAVAPSGFPPSWERHFS